MSLLSRLFGGGGGGGTPAPEPVEYEGFRIYPEPVSEGGQYRIGARIEAEIDGTLKEHRLIRADMLRDREEAETASVNKAKQMIDQMGARLFD
ncbi:HlyU family transcriptional regulator [Pseudoponticoccus marisrubri]|uniref:Uncharacterized protein n=1 Tax=Pseudoponticoccus marisrubri TaxID=1685382 RepID=A0A0W7WFG1_9RHOB|nr:HlyU family transcriptional regulator [Pseudoponticoccus marisrubri]KUF09263.1 hypothetical protein AVJ23_18590 [Pseudoponticoccus marisrubri]